MLKEISNPRQVKGDPKRRWFSDKDFDLIVWLDEENKIVGFQLCYDKSNNEHALTWYKKKGYTHHSIDTGENRPGMFKATPVLVADGVFNYKLIANNFLKSNKNIDKEISSFVINWSDI